MRLFSLPTFHQARPTKVPSSCQASRPSVLAGNVKEERPDSKPRCSQGKPVTRLESTGATSGSAVLYCGVGELKWNNKICFIAQLQALRKQVCISLGFRKYKSKNYRNDNRAHCLCQKVIEHFLSFQLQNKASSRRNYISPDPYMQGIHAHRTLYAMTSGN